MFVPSTRVRTCVSDVPALAVRLGAGGRVPECLRGGVVAIGNFDGVHHGHRCLLRCARTLAEDLGTFAIALTFDPHPRVYFGRTQAWFELTTCEEKVKLLCAEGVGVAVASFDAALAAMTAREFLETTLIDGLGAAGVVVGDDFKCGKDQVTIERLRPLAQSLDLPLHVMDGVAGQHGRVSSTAIRSAIVAGDLRTAAALLAR